MSDPYSSDDLLHDACRLCVCLQSTEIQFLVDIDSTSARSKNSMFFFPLAINGAVRHVSALDLWAVHEILEGAVNSADKQQKPLRLQCQFVHANLGTVSEVVDAVKGHYRQRNVLYPTENLTNCLQKIFADVMVFMEYITIIDSLAVKFSFPATLVTDWPYSGGYRREPVDRLLCTPKSEYLCMPIYSGKFDLNFTTTSEDDSGGEEEKKKVACPKVVPFVDECVAHFSVRTNENNRLNAWACVFMQEANEQGINYIRELFRRPWDTADCDVKRAIRKITIPNEASAVGLHARGQRAGTLQEVGWGAVPAPVGERCYVNYPRVTTREVFVSLMSIVAPGPSDPFVRIADYVKFKPTTEGAKMDPFPFGPQPDILFADGKRRLMIKCFDPIIARIKGGRGVTSEEYAEAYTTVYYLSCGPHMQAINDSQKLYELAVEEAKKAAEVIPPANHAEWITFVAGVFKYLDRFFVKRMELPKIKDALERAMAPHHDP